MTDYKPVDKLTFEQAMEESERIVKSLESGNIGLEFAMSQYARAKELLEYCGQKLNSAQLTVQQIVEKDNQEIELIDAMHLKEGNRYDG